MDRAALQAIARRIIHFDAGMPLELQAAWAQLPEADALFVAMTLCQAAEARELELVRDVLRSLDRQGKKPPEGYLYALDHAARPRPAAHAPRRNQERDARIRTAFAAIRPHVKSDSQAFGLIVDVVPEIASRDAVRKIVRK